MAGFRYRVLDLPVVGAGAYLPTAAINPVASSYGLVHVYGAPGTLPVPVSKPESVWAPPTSADKMTQPSWCAPDVILPSIYIASAENMGPSQHFGMAMRRHTPLPVPAVTWISLAKRAMVMRKVGGRRSIPWPRAFQRFPTQ